MRYVLLSCVLTIVFIVQIVSVKAFRAKPAQLNAVYLFNSRILLQSTRINERSQLEHCSRHYGAAKKEMNDESEKNDKISKGFGETKSDVITPNRGVPNKKSIEKFLMMYTCKICSTRNAQMVMSILSIFQ